MNDELKQKIESELKNLLYEPKNIDVIEDALKRLKDMLGDKWVVSYIRPDDPTNAAKFAFATKKTPKSEYTLWTFEITPPHNGVGGGLVAEAL